MVDRPSEFSSEGRRSTDRSNHRSTTSTGVALEIGSPAGSSSHSFRTSPTSTASPNSSGSRWSRLATRWASPARRLERAWRPAFRAGSASGMAGTLLVCPDAESGRRGG